MNRKEFIKFINDNIEFLTTDSLKEYKDDNDEIKSYVIKGHPNFYLLHTKEEFDKKLKSIIPNKDIYNNYDVYYYMNYMFKYMLGKYDSHTNIDFINSLSLPFRTKIINNIPYIISLPKRVEDYNGTAILKINDIDINIIINELEKIICYASNDYRNYKLELMLRNSNILFSLPCFNKTNKFKITTDKGDIYFDLNIEEHCRNKFYKENYHLDIKDDTAIITYNSCFDEEKMIDLVGKIKKMDYINNYIVDLRGNCGGNEYIINHLGEVLDGKNVIALSDERVFSSARTSFIYLKCIGAKIIGNSPGTPINCFGSCKKKRKYDDMNLYLRGSIVYWYFDKNFRRIGIYNDTWNDAIKEIPDLLDTVFINVDEKVEMTLDDYVNGNATVLKYALNEIAKCNYRSFK